MILLLLIKSLAKNLINLEESLYIYIIILNIIATLEFYLSAIRGQKPLDRIGAKLRGPFQPLDTILL